MVIINYLLEVELSWKAYHKVKWCVCALEYGLLDEPITVRVVP